MRRLCLAAVLVALASAAAADPLTGKSYIIQLSSSQYSSGYGEYLVPPLAAVLRKSGMRAVNGPGADLVINVETDFGCWSMGKAWRQKALALYHFSDRGDFTGSLRNSLRGDPGIRDYRQFEDPKPGPSGRDGLSDKTRGPHRSGKLPQFGNFSS